MIKKLGNKGVTIVEMIVALVLFFIISTVSLSITISSINSSNKESFEFLAINKTTDLLQIYKTSTSIGDYIANIKSIYGVDSVDDKVDKIESTYFGDKNPNFYVLINNVRFFVTIENKKATIESIVVDHEKIIYTNSYLNGDING